MAEYLLGVGPMINQVLKVSQLLIILTKTIDLLQFIDLNINDTVNLSFKWKLLTSITWLIPPSEPIYTGIIHCLVGQVVASETAEQQLLGSIPMSGKTHFFFAGPG